MASEKPSMPLILGIGALSDDLSVRKDLVEAARQNNIKSLDTARHYVCVPYFPVDSTAHSLLQSGGKSEKFIGDNGLSSEFQIITKASMGLVPGGSTKGGIMQQCEESAKALKIDRVRQLLSKLLNLLTTAQVSIYLLHTPDIHTPISSTMEGIQALYLAGKFDQVRTSPLHLSHH